MPIACKWPSAHNLKKNNKLLFKLECHNWVPDAEPFGPGLTNIHFANRLAVSGHKFSPVSEKICKLNNSQFKF